MTARPPNAESPRTRISPVTPAPRAQVMAWATIRAAPLADPALPARSLIPAITGADTSVLIVAASGERPLCRIGLPDTLLCLCGFGCPIYLSCSGRASVAVGIAVFGSIGIGHRTVGFTETVWIPRRSPYAPPAPAAAAARSADMPALAKAPIRIAACISSSSPGKAVCSLVAQGRHWTGNSTTPCARPGAWAPGRWDRSPQRISVLVTPTRDHRMAT